VIGGKVYYVTRFYNSSSGKLIGQKYSNISLSTSSKIDYTILLANKTLEVYCGKGVYTIKVSLARCLKKKPLVFVNDYPKNISVTRMDLGLKSHVVLITGSSRGIGQAIALEFAQEGARVAITGRNQKDVSNTVNQINESGGEGFGFVGDMTNEGDIKRCIDKVIEQWGAFDALVANLGSGKGQRGCDVDVAEWNRLMELNLMISVKIATASIPHLKKSEDGNIIFIGSIAGLESLGAPPPYEVAKSALIAYSKNLSKEVAKDLIRVNIVAPGNIMFPGSTWDEKMKSNREAIQDLIEAEVPLKRFGKTEEVANAVLFLASRKASFITGACLVVDGGQTRAF
jgi:3-oxoacyl-[acyl-carrier protein] reductase